MTKHLHYQFFWRFLGCVWLLVISVLSVIRIAQPLDFNNADKWMHWLAWMLMMVWFGSSWPSAKIRCFMFLLAASAALELLQDLLPWRFMDVNDLVANLAGLLTGTVLLLTQIRGLLPWVDRVLANRFDTPLV